MTKLSREKLRFNADKDLSKFEVAVMTADDGGKRAKADRETKMLH